MSNLEKYNQTGMRDAYNVLKHIEKRKEDKMKLGDPEDPIEPEEEFEEDEGEVEATKKEIEPEELEEFEEENQQEY